MNIIKPAREEERGGEYYPVVYSNGAMHCSCGNELIKHDDGSYKCAAGYPIYRFEDGDVIKDKFGNLSARVIPH